MKKLIEDSIEAIAPPALAPHIIRFVLFVMPVILLYYAAILTIAWAGITAFGAIVYELCH